MERPDLLTKVITAKDSSSWTTNIKIGDGATTPVLSLELRILRSKPAKDTEIVVLKPLPAVNIRPNAIQAEWKKLTSNAPDIATALKNFQHWWANISVAKNPAVVIAMLEVGVPDDAVNLLFNFMADETIMKLGLSCKAWHSIVDQDSIWDQRWAQSKYELCSVGGPIQKLNSRQKMALACSAAANIRSQRATVTPLLTQEESSPPDAYTSMSVLPFATQGDCHFLSCTITLSEYRGSYDSSRTVGCKIFSLSDWQNARVVFHSTQDATDLKIIGSNFAFRHVHQDKSILDLTTPGLTERRLNLPVEVNSAYDYYIPNTVAAFPYLAAMSNYVQQGNAVVPRAGTLVSIINVETHQVMVAPQMIDSHGYFNSVFAGDYFTMNDDRQIFSLHHIDAQSRSIKTICRIQSLSEMLTAFARTFLKKRADCGINCTHTINDTTFAFWAQCKAAGDPDKIHHAFFCCPISALQGVTEANFCSKLSLVADFNTLGVFDQMGLRVDQRRFLAWTSRTLLVVDAVAGVLEQAFMSESTISQVIPIDFTLVVMSFLSQIYVIDFAARDLMKIAHPNGASSLAVCEPHYAVLFQGDGTPIKNRISNGVFSPGTFGKMIQELFDIDPSFEYLRLDSFMLQQATKNQDVTICISVISRTSAKELAVTVVDFVKGIDTQSDHGAPMLAVSPEQAERVAFNMNRPRHSRTGVRSWHAQADTVRGTALPQEHQGRQIQAIAIKWGIHNTTKKMSFYAISQQEARDKFEARYTGAGNKK